MMTAQGLDEVKLLSAKVDTIAAALARIETNMKETNNSTPKFGTSFKQGASWRRGSSSASFGGLQQPPQIGSA